MKHLVYLWLFLSTNVSAQNNSLNDSLFQPLTFANLHDIEYVYKISNRDDSSVVLEVLKVLQDKREIFILIKKDTNWSTRYFVKESKRDNLYRELEIKPKNKKYLWQSLRMKKIFVLPDSDEIKDSIGQPIKLHVQNEIFYHFKIVTHAGERELIYNSPETYMKEFPQESVYRDVVALLSMIYTFCGLDYKY